MAIRATVLPQPTPGHAVLRISELDAAPEGLMLSIQRQQGPDSHLGSDGWRRTEAWLEPTQIVRLRGVLDFHLGPEICDRLAGIATVRLRIQEPHVGVVASTVVAWPAMLTSGAIGPTRLTEDDAVSRQMPIQEVEPPAPPFVTELPPEPPRPLPDLRAARDSAPVPDSTNWTSWLIAALVVILAAGGAGYYAYRTYFRPADTVATTTKPATDSAASPTPLQPKAAEVPKKSIRDTVADYLATKPTPEAMVAKGHDYAQAGEIASAFLVWRRAAEAGNVQAELELAGYYDPLSQRSNSGFTPDAARAADWYERAALAGNAEAQRKLGLLLAKGAPGVPADPAKAKSWLQQAAAQNDADAKKALDTLPK